MQEQSKEDAQLVEQTAKKWKKVTLLAAAIFGGGFFLFILGVAASSKSSGFGTFLMFVGGIGLVAGIGTAIYARVMAWWFHG